MSQSFLSYRRPGNLIARPFGGRWPHTRLFGVGPHWYRQRPADADNRVLGPCAYHDCGRPYYQHWQAAGEWFLPRPVRWNLIRMRAATRLTEPRRHR